MNDLPTIKDWTEAMNCVFETLQAMSRNKELSAPIQISKTKLEIYKASSINVKPLHKDETSAVKTVNKIKRFSLSARRRAFKGKRLTSRTPDPMEGDRPMDKAMTIEKLKVVWRDEPRKGDGDVSMCRATPVIAKSVKVDGDRKRIKLELKDTMQSVEVVGDKVIASGTVGDFDKQPMIIEEQQEDRKSKTGPMTEAKQERLKEEADWLIDTPKRWSFLFLENEGWDTEVLKDPTILDRDKEGG